MERGWRLSGRDHSLTSWFRCDRPDRADLERCAHKIEGAISFLARTGAEFSDLPNWFRPIDIDDGHLFRFMIRAVRVDDRPVLEARLSSSNDAALFRQSPGAPYTTQVHTSHTSTIEVLQRGVPYHIAVTFRTYGEGWITMALWVAEGADQELNVGALATPYGSVRFRIRDRVTRTSFENALNYGGTYQFSFGVCGATSNFQTQSFDALRIWDPAPHVIPAPE